ncbi:MAG TPA: hypothetical protein VEB42_02130, partial [Chitinophagaceae bacterium]|nr:hypothetical protein [Chitinophagaceae bacterium]
MKSRLLCMALLTIVCSVKAQKFKQNVSFGPVVGLGHAWIHGVDGDNEFKLAPSAGVTLTYSAGVHW